MVEHGTPLIDRCRQGTYAYIIFDLTGDPELRKKLRAAVQESHNQHTVIAPEVVAHLLWNFFGEGELPTSGQTGYGGMGWLPVEISASRA